MKIKIYNKKYDAAFRKYLRYVTPISEPYYLVRSAPENDMYFYIWRTQEDRRVRATHAANNGKIFSYNIPPPTGHPGYEVNCRCYAEDVHAKFDGIDDSVSKYDINTWPTVPINGKLVEGLPSKNKPRSRGEKSLYDIYGGEWKPHTIDLRHNLHWDYKPAGKCTEWLNIPINGKEPKIIKKHKYLKYRKMNMLHVRCFDDFDSGPQILIFGDAEDYLKAGKYLSNKKSALLNDKNCFRYFPPEINFRDEWLVINEAECQELAKLFIRFANNPGCYHDYFDLESLKDVTFEIRISMKEYDKEMFYD